MARRKEKEKALELRKKGYSYSMIKNRLGISKSTLSNWLADFPLPLEKIKKLQADNPRRIEKRRETMRRKREVRRNKVRSIVDNDIGSLTKRDVFLGGLFLYWGEGLKASNGYTISLANTDPTMLLFFVRWLEEVFEIKRERLKVKLHLYSDMNIQKETEYWSRVLGVPAKNFQKPYIKNTKRYDITYKRYNNHGTCNVHCYGRDITEYVLEALKYIQKV